MRRSTTPDHDPFDEDDDSSSDGDRIALQQLLSGLLVRWHWIILGLTLGLLGSLYYLSKAPKIYRATSTILIKERGATLLDKKQDDEMSLVSYDVLNTMVEGAKSAALFTKVASRPEVSSLEGLIPGKVNWLPSWAGLWLDIGESKDAEIPANPKAETLGKMIGAWTSVEIRKDTRLLDLTVTHPDPEVCRIIADAIANQYVAEVNGGINEELKSTITMLGAQLEKAEQKLQVAKNSLASYQQVLETLKGLEEREATVNSLALVYRDKHPEMIEARAELSDFETRFLFEFQSVRQAKADLDYWKETENEWNQSASDRKKQLQIARRDLIARESLLQSDILAQDAVLNSLRTSRLEAIANSGGNQTDVKIQTLASRPDAPSSPRKTLILIGGGAGGLFAGFALAFLLVKLDNKIHTTLELELLTELPTLATIAELPPRVLRQILSRKGLAPEDLPKTKRNWSRPILLREELSDTIYAEMFRILRASITLLGVEEKRKITLFSSALPGEGKTTIATNFAIASAQQGKKTLLLDLDLRKPAVHRLFGLKRSELTSGVTEILAGQIPWEDTIQTGDKLGQKHLHCIFAGAKAPNPGELLNTDNLEELFSRLTEEYDHLVIDSAPILAVPDTRLIIPAVDNFCLVVRAEQTPKGAVRKIIDLLKVDGISPSGVVLNGYQEKKGLLGRSRYGYGGYGGYGQHGKGYGTYGSDDDDS